MVAPEERVFQTFGLDHGEIQFSILVSGGPWVPSHSLIYILQWPGYGHISWIASIPINSCKRRGHQHGPMTRRLLALAVAQHFQAFVTVSLPRTNEFVRSLTILNLEFLVFALP